MYSCEEYTAIEHKLCCTPSTDTSAIMCLYDSIDKWNKHCENFQRVMKHSYSVIIITAVVKSASVSLSGFMNSIQQLADDLPDEVIANGVIVNVCNFFV